MGKPKGGMAGCCCFQAVAMSGCGGFAGVLSDGDVSGKFWKAMVCRVCPTASYRCGHYTGKLLGGECVEVALPRIRCCPIWLAAVDLFRWYFLELNLMQMLLAAFLKILAAKQR